jgi:hypothetical protein
MKFPISHFGSLAPTKVGMQRAHLQPTKHVGSLFPNDHILRAIHD